MEPNNKIYDTIIHYLSSQLGENEVQQFESWLNESNDNQILFNNISKHWNLSEKMEPEQKIRAWYNLNSNIDDRNRGFLKRNAFSIAVAATILILTTAGWFLNTTTKKIINITTGENTFKRDTLENGCVVFLYPSSSIETEKTPSAVDNQVINLKGQAFFIVPPKLGKLVKIKIGEACIEVKGTSFKVNGTNDNEISVLVESGEVLMQTNSNENKQLLVHAGEEGFYYRDKNQFSKKLKTEEIYIIYQPNDSTYIR